MKILSLTEDQYQLLKNQYEDEMELALKYVEDIRNILFKLNKQEAKIVKEKKPRKKRRGRKPGVAKAAAVAPETAKKSKPARKKRGRKPKAVKAAVLPAKSELKAKAKPAPKKRKRRRRTSKAKAKASVVKKAAPVKAKPVKKRKAPAAKAKPANAARPVTPKSVELKAPVKTFIDPEVKKEE